MICPAVIESGAVTGGLARSCTENCVAPPDTLQFVGAVVAAQVPRRVATYSICPVDTAVAWPARTTCSPLVPPSAVVRFGNTAVPGGSGLACGSTMKQLVTALPLNVPPAQGPGSE